MYFNESMLFIGFKLRNFMSTPCDNTSGMLEQFSKHLSLLMIRDSERLKKEIDIIKSRIEKKLPVDQKLSHLEKIMCLAIDRVSTRLKAVPNITFPDNLPVSERRKEIAEQIKNNQVIVLAGETGSGKTTQLPKICLSLGLGIKGLIGHTQPRRIAARTVAQRIAEELGQELGHSVGYQVRFTDHSNENTHIKLMTDGILLTEIQSDPLLLKYDVIIIDEAHERSLNIDFLLGYLKRLKDKRTDLKIIITSATIDVERFSKHFSDAPVIEVSGRTYPVDVYYRPWQDSFEDQIEAIVNCIEEILTSPEKNNKKYQAGDILIFLSGEREIRETSLAIKKAQFRNLRVLPLYARLSISEQTQVFETSGSGRRVVLATNVAETSITVPGIRYVIDPGMARISRYSLRTKVQRLPIEAISQASANQRKGRCGRVSDGVCYRLYSEDDFLSRPEFTDPEIQRTNLAAVVLQMLHLRMGDIKYFPFVDRPDQKMINDGYKLLEELNAVDNQGKITSIGRELQRLPIDPKLARMVVESKKIGGLDELLIIVSGMSIQDPRERPADKQQAADEKHRRFFDEKSDFIAYVNLWNYLEEQRQELSQNQLRKLCKREFLNYLRIREWRDLHRQLKLSLEKGLGSQSGKHKNDKKIVKNKKTEDKITHENISYEFVHRSIISGLLSNVALKNEESGSREYLGTRNRKTLIFPASSQNKKRPKWIVAADFIETSQLFAHTVAKIDPLWVLQLADHLVKRNYFEPHYDVRSGQVKAFVKISLFGLVLVEKKRVNYNKIDDQQAREVFIRSALVEGLYRGKGAFFKHNERLIKEIEELEAKSRRSDILIDDEDIYRFYNELIPNSVVNLAGFEHWRKQASLDSDKENKKDNEHFLFLSHDRLMRHTASHITQDEFPSELELDGFTLPITYVFEPGKANDGVNLHVPISLLHQLPEYRLEWLVPGLLRDKCISLVKGLPKSIRKRFVPVPQYVDKALIRMKPCNTPLTEKLGESLSHLTQVNIAKEDWRLDILETLYIINLVVVDDTGKAIETSRSLSDIRQRYRSTVQKTIQKAGDAHEQKDIVKWNFGTLEKSLELDRGAVKVKAYPAIVDKKDSVDLKVVDNPLDALALSRTGRCRLALKSLSGSVKYLKKELFKGKDIGLTQVNMGRKDDVIDDLLLASVYEACFGSNKQDIDQIVTESDFEEAIEKGKKSFIEQAMFFEKVLVECLTLVVQIKKQMKSSKNVLQMTFTFGDIKDQLNSLLYPGSLFQTSREHFADFPRYLRAILHRIEKAPMNINKDKDHLRVITEFWSLHQNRLEQESINIYLINEQWQEFRWLIEEFRVSLFAQTLKTRKSVSAKRLKQQWELSLEL